MGTDTGFDRFDPYHGTSQRYESRFWDPESREHARVDAITSDRAGRVWCASFAAPNLLRVDPRTGKTTRHVIPGPANGQVTAVYVDRSDRLWVATQHAEASPPSERLSFRWFAFGGCSQIRDGVLPSPQQPCELDPAGGKVMAILEDASARLWFGRDGGGLLRFDPRGADQGAGPASGLPASGTSSASLRHLAADPLNPDALAHGIVRSLAFDPTGGLWVLTHPENPGVPDPQPRLHRVDPDTLVVRRITLRQETPQAGSDASIERLTVDRSGVLWLGSNAGGLRYVDVAAQGFALYREGSAGAPGLDSSYVRAVCRTRDGVLWVGTPRGLNRIDRSPGKRVYASTSSDGFLELPHPNVQAIHEDRDGNLWIGTAGGLAMRERASGTLHSYRADPTRPGSLSDDYVQVIHEGPDGRMWIGTLGKGVDEVDRETRSFTHCGDNRNDPTRLPSGTIHAIASDQRGRLWFGTGAGLAVLESPWGQERHFHRIAALEGDAILSVGGSPATPEVLWIGTAQRGLGRLELNGETCRFYTSRNSGLPDNTVYAILTDRRGRLWLSTNRGLACFDPGADTFRTYGVERGLQSSEFNSRAGFQADDGEMFFGGVAGLNSFYPDQITDNPYAPAVLIARVSVTPRGAKDPESAALPIYRHGGPRSVAPIPYPQRDLTFDFVALHYSDPAKNRCEYRLDDYDQDWHGPVAERRVRYTNLDPGRYTFRVRALSSQGVRSVGEAAFAFEVLPPFYATAWFRALLAFGLGSALFGAYRFRVRTLRRRHDELEGQVAQRTEELRQALATVEGQAQKLQELDAAKSKFFANLSHEFRTPLMLTLGPLRDLQSGRHGAVSPKALAAVDLAIRNTGRQLELVDQLLMLARLDAGHLEYRPRESRLDEFLRQAVAPYESLAAGQQVQFRCELPEAPVPGWFDEGHLDHIIGNLLGNAFKFTPAGGTVTLRLRLAAGGWAVIHVEDTGPGIAAQDLPRIFERFYRGEPSAGQRPGTGIGLAVAKECVELHGGTIQAENRAEGGARFAVRLPLTPAPKNS